MVIYGIAHTLEPFLKSFNLFAGSVLCKYNAANHKTDVGELADKSYCVVVICNAKVASELCLVYVLRADNYNDFSLVLKLKKHLELAVGLEAWQNS